ncbi:tRNA epoxyqueuosine(34) reductase QueG [Acuticoccus sp. I52.16.1]|uniref:tRNA epoxyqueuosine(34) reductase QueG n=1 Tax=Acuticoccus sp. I52.16.1 TaxID=2928472 RepID=UPI001FD37FD1|nr:tRNA epoxyqueuosine(34) reductase QueG [Acuticoccus sp. I52.16.1]UOM35658.1 tRNA epoxyqueuosine(34) reductase QueG [Acuticoccus sp. I52.16.1]
MPTSTSSEAAKRFLREDALAAGFFDLRVADPATFAAVHGARLEAAVAAGHHGDMAWLPATAARRRHPQALWAEARSVIMLGMNYGPRADPMKDLARRDRGVVSVYARGRDYHDVMKGRLKGLAQRLVARFGGDVKVFVDTAPVMEKPLAAAAGLGWQGKHTNLVSRRAGSWLFLGAIFTTLELAPDDAERDHCGSCRRCLDVCPTNAFPAPYRLDARRCLAYLTVEARGMIPRPFRAGMGNRIFGCDDCLAVCPWNRFAQEASEMKLAGEDEPAPLAELASLDDAAFRTRYAGTPVKRLGRERFVRNVMVAVGNAGEPALAPLIEARTADAAPQVRAAAVWAAGRVLPADRLAALRLARRSQEHDPLVLNEWHHEEEPCTP